MYNVHKRMSSQVMQGLEKDLVHSWHREISYASFGGENIYHLIFLKNISLHISHVVCDLNVLNI